MKSEITQTPGSFDLSLSHSGHPPLRVLSSESVCLHSLSSTIDFNFLPFYAKEKEQKIMTSQILFINDVIIGILDCRITVHCSGNWTVWPITKSAHDKM